MMEFITDAISAVTTTVSQLLTNIGGSTAEFFQSLILTETGSLNSMGLFIFMLLGISLALAIVGWVTSLVRNRR